MLVGDVLKAKGRRLIFIGPEATVEEALALFVEHNIGALPVAGASGELLGIFTERDVILGNHYDFERFHHKLIKEVETPQARHLQPEGYLGRSHHQDGQTPRRSVASGRWQQPCRVDFRR